MTRRMAAAGVVVALWVTGCAAGSPSPAKEPEAATQKAQADSKAEPSDAPSDATPSAKAQDATEAKAEAKPAAEPIPVSQEDPGDSGAVQLGADHAKKVVAANQPFLAEYCWAKAMKQNPQGPKKVRVATEVEVEPNGTPKRVKVVGGDAYTGLAACVEKHMMLWTYPRAKKASSLMFPIVLEHKEVETLVR